MRVPLSTVLSAALLLGSGGHPLAQENSPAPSVALEALSRLKGMDLEANPSLKAAVYRVLDQVRGRPEFVEIVRDFKITGEDGALLELAARQPGTSAGVEAVRIVLGAGQTNRVWEALAGTNAAGLVEALGNTGDRHAVPLLEPLPFDEARDAGVRRRAVKALAQTVEGAQVILKSVRDQRLPEEYAFLAGTALRQSPSPAIQAEAAKVFPPRQGRDGRALPPVAELVRLQGDPQRGAEVFRRDTVACIRCHRVQGEGVDVGPALSEIGTKLGRDALFESILDPSAGIAFGYEAWRVELKDGDEVFGLIVSETAEELAVKLQTGVVSRYPKAEVVRRERQKLSIMPAGLEQALSVQELVDLVAYLGSLRKAAPAGGP